MKMTINVNPFEIAKEFSEYLKKRLDKKSLDAAIKENHKRNDDTDAVQDYCDANVVMESAFQSIVFASDNEDVAKIWNKAWNIAKSCDYDVTKIDNFSNENEEVFPITVISTFEHITGPRIFKTVVEVTRHQFLNGAHYEAVEKFLTSKGFKSEKNYIHFDEIDMPDELRIVYKIPPKECSPFWKDC